MPDPRKDEPEEPEAESEAEELEAEPCEPDHEEPLVVEAASVGNGTNHAWGMACHLSTLLTFVTPLGQIGGLLAPIVIWQFLREGDPSVEENAREAFNFQANLLFWFLVGVILSFTCILTPVGICLLIAVPVANVVLTIVAACKVADGERFRYPWIYRVLPDA